MPASKELQTSFDLPPKLTIGLLEKFEREARKALKDAEKLGELTSVRNLAIVFQAGVKAGLYQNWNSKLMPNPDTDNIDEAETHVILWAGTVLDEWIGERRTVPKVSFLRRLIMGLARVKKHRPN